MHQVGIRSEFGLDHHGLHNLGIVYWNLSPPELIEHAVRRKEGELANLGAFVVSTGFHTGRAPNDKYFAQNDLELYKPVSESSGIFSEERFICSRYERWQPSR